MNSRVNTIVAMLFMMLICFANPTNVSAQIEGGEDGPEVQTLAFDAFGSNKPMAVMKNAANWAKIFCTVNAYNAAGVATTELSASGHEILDIDIGPLILEDYKGVGGMHVFLFSRRVTITYIKRPLL